MNIAKFHKIMNCFIASVLLVLWGSVLFIHGIAGAVAWGLAKLFIAPIGFVLLLISLVILIICLIKKKRVFQITLSFLLSMLLAFPILLLFNVIPIEYPANISKASPSITVRWPFNETATVAWGGTTVELNAPHAIWASERWAYDLFMEPADMGSHMLEDYGVYNKEVVAPISGTVVAAYDDEDDIPPNTEKFLSMVGNYVYLRIDETNTFLLLVHLKKDSVRVKVGQHLKEGDIIGAVGNSGATSEPHLHIHHQRQDPTKTIYPVFAEGLPLYFKNIDGDPTPVKGAIITPSN